MSKSIIEFITEYKRNNKLYAIPDFQREFSWKESQIEDLFDSIFRSYPLPRFFVWSIPQDTPVTLFNIVQNFEEKPYKSFEFQDDDYQPTGHIAICDGQQRLTSLLIGILGKNFPKSIKSKRSNFLHFDILYNSVDVEIDNDQKRKRFAFMTEERASQESELGDSYWIKVSTFFDYYILNNSLPANQIITRFSDTILITGKQTTEKIIIAHSNLQTFLLAIAQPNYLDFQNLQGVIGYSLDEAVEFFKRINSGGKNLSRNNVLFSLVSRNLQRPEFIDIKLRNDFQTLSYDYCNKDTGVFKKEITWDFFLRVCLYITSNQILFRVNSFNQTKCIDILKDWPSIKESIRATFDLVKKLHIGNIIVSMNSLIPLIYHFYKKKNIIDDVSEKSEILKYIIRSQFSNVFGSHGDTLLTALKQNQEKKYESNSNYLFSFEDLNTNLPTDKSFSVRAEKIETMLNYEYGESMIKPILTLLTKGLNSYANYQVDHIHPEVICKSIGTLYNHDVTGNIDYIIDNYNKLPNLQLLIENCNQSKQDKSFYNWLTKILEGYRSNQNDLSCMNGREDIKRYLEENLINIPEGEQPESFLEINNFKIFFDRRKELLRNLLIEALIDD